MKEGVFNQLWHCMITKAQKSVIKYILLISVRTGKMVKGPCLPVISPPPQKKKQGKKEHTDQHIAIILVFN